MESTYLGYLVTQDELDQTLEEFKEQFGEKPLSEKKPSRETDLGIIVAHNDDPTGTETLSSAFGIHPFIYLRYFRPALRLFPRGSKSRSQDHQGDLQQDAAARDHPCHCRRPDRNDSLSEERK